MNFSLVNARSMEHALSLLQEHGPGCRVLAGGTDLTVAYRRGKLVPPAVLVNLKTVGGLDGIEFDPQQGLTIGALARVGDLADSPLVRSRYPALAEAAETLGSIQVRNLATVGGNLCNASPAADLAPPLLVHGARAVMTGPAGRRELPLAEFFTGPGRTALAPGELLVAVKVPPPTMASAFLKFGPRQALIIAMVSVAAAVELDPRSGVCRGARIALGAVAPTPLRAPAAEELLVGQRLGADTIAAVAAAAASSSRPITDPRASAEFRRQLVAALTKRALGRLAEGSRL